LPRPKAFPSHADCSKGRKRNYQFFYDRSPHVSNPAPYLSLVGLSRADDHRIETGLEAHQ
jgi:hypothetical protein